MSRFQRTFFASAVVLLSLTLGSASHAEDGVGTNYEARLGSLEEQMRTMNGRLEQIEFATRRIEASVQRMQSDNDARLMHLEQTSMGQPQATNAPQAAVVVPPANSNLSTAGAYGDQPAPVNGSLGAIKMQDGHVTGAINNPQHPPLPQTPPDYGLTPQEQYDRAFELLRQANYDDAGDAFQAFISNNPKDKLVDNAKYWYGETLYVRGKYDNAAVAFADAYQANPQGSKAPDSLLKLAMSLEALNKAPDACTTLDSLKGKYPNASSNVRQRADQERSKLKCDVAAH